MLGNWSFGDYYKREAILWAWELLTGVWKLPKAALWATVHTTDDEAAALWSEVTDVDRARVLRFDAENFWEMGETGPCGPCSEIHIDRGPDTCDRSADPAHRCGVNVGCARFIEIWNLVFIQYNRDEARKLTELPAKHVDPGMGLERVASVLQGVPTNYDCDLLRSIISRAEKLSGKRYGRSTEDDVSLRVIADHGRAVTFLIADGVLPSNEGRGYVLRRLLRRAARHGKLRGLSRPFLHEVVDAVVHTMGRAYPELVERQGRIVEAVRDEEERFAATLDRGLALLASEIERARRAGQIGLPGDVAFRLPDTYGFPPDLTEDILGGERVCVARPGVARAKEEPREAARLNHSATHIVHAALRHQLGPHVRQAGSLVTPERLRFDFNHTRPVGEGPLAEIEDEVNAQIRGNLEVWSEELPYDQAIKAGALAFFGEKYGDQVTGVHIGDYSVELCGGTH